MTMHLPSLFFLINITRDLLFVILFVKTIDLNRKETTWRKPVALFVLIALNLSMLILDNYFYEIHFDLLIAARGHAVISYTRNILSFSSYFLYIMILKKLPPKVIFYDALLISSINLACHNVFLTPLTKPIIDSNVMWVENPFFNKLLCVLVVNAVSIIIYAVIYKLISLKHIHYVDKLRILLLLLLVLVSVYFNGSIKAIEFIDPIYAKQLSAYLILLQFLILLCIIYFEHYKYISETQNRVMLENQAVHSLLRTIKRQEKNDDLIHQIRHDLKNHLISLRYLIFNGETDKALSYVDSLTSEYILDDPRIRTGNMIVDGILLQKIEVAQEHNINISVAADFSFIEDMNKIDVCVIFGNLLDNALEGCQKVDKAARFINIRGRQVGETAIYSIENSSQGKVEFAKELPITTKTEKHIHGIGLRSVKDIVEKYSGTIVFSSKENLFKVVCAFPIPLTK